MDVKAIETVNPQVGEKMQFTNMKGWVVCCLLPLNRREQKLYSGTLESLGCELKPCAATF